VKIDWSKPGLPISGGVHAALLVGTLVAFSSTPKYEDAAEAVPVEIVSASEISQVTRGEKTAKEVKPEPKARVDRVAEREEQKPQTAEAKRDVPAPVSRPPQPEPEKKPEPQPAPTPPPQRAEAPKPEPKPEPKTEPPKPEPRRQDVAEDGLQRAEKKPEPKPEPPKPEPPRAERPRPEPPKPQQPDQVARLIEDAKRQEQKPAPAPKTEPTQRPFNPNEIKKLLESKERPQQSGATGSEVNRVASLGSPTATGQKMNPSQRDQLGSLIKDQLAKCWSPPAGVSEGENLKPVIKLSLQQDGSLIGVPAVSNDRSDPAFRAMADSAVRAVRLCAPFKIPAQFLPFHGDWKDWTIIFDPREMLG